MSADLVISCISWERVHLSLTARFAGPQGAVGFALVSPRRSLPLPSTDLGDGTHLLALNVTTFDGRGPIPDGEYEIVATTPTGRSAASFDLAHLDDLDAASRTFLYGADTGSYSVVFTISDDDHPVVRVRVFEMSRTPPPAGGSFARRMVERVVPQSRRVTLANRWYRMARTGRRLRPRHGRRILFASEMRERMGGNLLRVHERMIERGIDRDFAIRFSFRVPRTSGKFTTLKVIYLLATSDIVIIDDYFGVLGVLDVDPDTKIIQAWHAGSGFKNIGYSRFGKYGSPNLRNAHRRYTFAITGSTQLVPVYAEAFGIEESAVIPTGLPRIDTFLDPQRTARVVEAFHRDHPEFEGRRTILFAPTFRGRGVQDAHYDYDRLDFAALYDLCGTDTVLLFRMHHFVREPVPIPPQYADRLFDLTDHSGGNDLLHVTDILVTDYSSIIYEFSLLDRPMLFFAYDKAVYSATRGFHRDFDTTAPGKICLTIDDLVAAIRSEDFETWKIARFREANFDRVDTSAADRFIDELILGDPRHRPDGLLSGNSQDS